MTAGAKRGLEENIRFLKSGGNGMLGVHASFTCSNETLQAVADAAQQLNVGVHIHVAEGVDDIDAGARLEHLAQDDWLLVHAVHLDRPLRGTIAHNPRSNMNNAVGYAAPSKWLNNIVLGTDGIGADMLEEARLAYARLRESNVTETPDTVWTWLGNGEKFFPDVRNDVITWSYDNIDSPWHTAFTPGTRCTSVVIDGVEVVTNGLPTQFDLTEVRAKASEAARRLHMKLAS